MLRMFFSYQELLFFFHKCLMDLKCAIEGVDNMEAALIGLVGVLIGAAISTGASFWLAIRKEATETKNWRRERCLEVYTDILRACAIVMDEADKIYHMEPSAERVAQGKLLFEKVAEMYRLSDRVTLLGPREIHDSVSALTQYYATDIAPRAQK